MDDTFYDLPWFTTDQVKEYFNTIQEACIGICRGTECLRPAIWGEVAARVDFSVVASLLKEGFIVCADHTIGFVYIKADRLVDAMGHDVPKEKYIPFERRYQG